MKTTHVNISSKLTTTKKKRIIKMCDRERERERSIGRGKVMWKREKQKAKTKPSHYIIQHEHPEEPVIHDTDEKKRNVCITKRDV